jgi:hypothetical protein
MPQLQGAWHPAGPRNKFLIEDEILDQQCAEDLEYFRNGDRDFADWARISRSFPLRKARHRKPFHLGSNCQSGSRGKAVDISALSAADVRDPNLG